MLDVVGIGSMLALLLALAFVIGPEEAVCFISFGVPLAILALMAIMSYQ